MRWKGTPSHASLQHLAHRLPHLLARVRGRDDGLWLGSLRGRPAADNVAEPLPPRLLRLVDVAIARPAHHEVAPRRVRQRREECGLAGRRLWQEEEHQRAHVPQRRLATPRRHRLRGGPRHVLAPVVRGGALAKAPVQLHHLPPQRVRLRQRRQLVVRQLRKLLERRLQRAVRRRVVGHHGEPVLSGDLRGRRPDDGQLRLRRERPTVRRRHRGRSQLLGEPRERHEAHVEQAAVRRQHAPQADARVGVRRHDGHRRQRVRRLGARYERLQPLARRDAEGLQVHLHYGLSKTVSVGNRG